MASSSTPTSKDEWRAEFRAYRRALSASAYRVRSTLLTHRALGHPTVASAEVVHVYWPQSDRNEVDTRSLIAALWAQNVTVVLPVVTGYNPESPTMESRVYEGHRELTPNRWDILEPTEGPLVSPEALDVVLVPALGASRDGHRIGQGAGYYDAFLSSVPAPRIGLVYDACVVPALPTDEHDVPLTSIVTEQSYIRGTGTRHDSSSS